MPAPEPAKEASPPRQEEEQQEEEEEPLPTDSEVPNLEQLPDNGNGNGADLPGDVASEQLEKADATKDEPQEEEQEQQRATDSEEGQETQASVATADEPNEQQPQAKTDEELALEKQLADVQKQLAALSTLPSTIQSTLDAVTKQLAELLPTFKLQQQQQQQEGEKQQGEEEPPIDEEQQAEVAGKQWVQWEPAKNYGPG